MTAPAFSARTPGNGKLFWGFVLFTVIWFGLLGYRHLVPSDEGRYANIAREMVATGDWITPRYNGYKYFEKPVLQAWATAATYEVFGLGDWQSRLWTALTGWLGVLLAGYTGAKLFSRRAGVLAAAILGASPLWVGAGHFNTLDMGLSVMLEGALCSLLLAQAAGTQASARRGWMLGCWLFMALAVLSKGLVGLVLPGLVLVAYLVTTRDWPLLARLYLLPGLALFLVITAPWFVIVSLRNPEFAGFFFIHEHFQRFATQVHHRAGPLWYFVPLLIAGYLPWLALLPRSLQQAWRGLRTAAGDGLRVEWLLGLWAVLIFAFFSVSQSKLPGYIVPIFPALALLGGKLLDDQLKSGQLSRFWLVQTAFATVLAVAGLAALPWLSRLGDQPWQQREYAHYAYWVAVAMLTWLIGATAALALRRRAPAMSIGAFATASYLAFMIAGSGHDTLGRSRSGADLAEQVRPLLHDNVPLYSLAGLDHTLPWYLRHNLIMVAALDELEFGIQQEPDKWVPTQQAFLTRWAADADAFALMNPQTYDTLRAAGVPMTEIARDERRVVVRKPQP